MECNLGLKFFGAMYKLPTPTLFCFLMSVANYFRKYVHTVESTWLISVILFFFLFHAFESKLIPAEINVMILIGLDY